MISSSRRQQMRLEAELEALMVLIERAQSTGSPEPELAYLRAQAAELRRRLYG